MDTMADSALECESLDSLLGIEGNAAQMYFSRFRNLLKLNDSFNFNNRNKRPPTDPVNSVLSYLYGILTKDVFNALLVVGFDPYLGLYHQPKHGKPALALDLMEEFRPLIADSVAITLFNNEELNEGDFVKTSLGINMTPTARKATVRAYERRINSEITHPIFGYTISYRRVLEVQARLLGRALAGEIPEYPPLMTR
jgi:CRISPR-associated endonuclease Cas1